MSCPAGGFRGLLGSDLPGSARTGGPFQRQRHVFGESFWPDVDSGGGRS
jgi:hypothetical protein